MAKESCCSCGCEAVSKKKITIEYLFLDLRTCERCIGTDNVLDEVMITLTPALGTAGFEVEYNKIEMKTAEIAERYKFLSSPTIRVNGHDICKSVSENSCGCCSNISGTDVNCRVFEYNGKTYEVPPKEMLAEAILNAVFGKIEADCSCKEYKLPENLREFYEGKKKINKKGKFTMALFGKINKKVKTTSCCCGRNCDEKSMANKETAESINSGIKVLGSGCAKCNQLEVATKAALEQLGMDTTIEHVTDFSQIAAYGVMTTPALVIDGKVVSCGKVLKTEEIVKILQQVR